MQEYDIYDDIKCDVRNVLDVQMKHDLLPSY
jgi:hypothetical protein